MVAPGGRVLGVEKVEPLAERSVRSIQVCLKPSDDSWKSALGLMKRSTKSCLTTSESCRGALWPIYAKKLVSPGYQALDASRAYGPCALNDCYVHPGLLIC